MPSRPENGDQDLHGFDLKRVSWGYRRIFVDAISALLSEGTIGPARQEATRTFFELLKLARPGSFDFALKEFLTALNARTKWLLELPGLFEDFCRLGRELAEEKLAYGISFFRLWGQGGFGQTPERVTELLRHVRRLRGLDGELAQAFLVGYGRLTEQLSAGQVNLFVNQLFDLHGRNRQTAIDFAAMRLKSAAAFVRNLTQEARLEEMHDRLARLAMAIAGRAIEIENLSGLDSDALIENNSTVVCLQDHLYLPAKIRCCRARARNEALYLLGTVVAAAAVGQRSFAAVHGQAGTARGRHCWRSPRSCGSSSTSAGGCRARGGWSTSASRRSSRSLPRAAPPTPCWPSACAPHRPGRSPRPSAPPPGPAGTSSNRPGGRSRC